MFSPFAAVASDMPGLTASSVCAICGAGRNLISCSRCPLAFHRSCISETKRTQQNTPWRCIACRAVKRFDPSPSWQPNLPPPKLPSPESGFPRLTADALEGNPIDCVFNPSLYNHYCKMVGTDWLRCYKCETISIVDDGALSESVRVPFECRFAFWVPEKNRACNAAARAGLAPSAAEISVKKHLKLRSRHRNALFFNHFGEDNREDYGFPALPDYLPNAKPSGNEDQVEQLPILGLQPLPLGKRKHDAMLSPSSESLPAPILKNDKGPSSPTKLQRTSLTPAMRQVPQPQPPVIQTDVDVQMTEAVVTEAPNNNVTNKNHTNIGSSNNSHAIRVTPITERMNILSSQPYKIQTAPDLPPAIPQSLPNQTSASAALTDLSFAVTPVVSREDRARAPVPAYSLPSTGALISANTIPASSDASFRANNPRTNISPVVGPTPSAYTSFHKNARDNAVGMNQINPIIEKNDVDLTQGYGQGQIGRVPVNPSLDKPCPPSRVVSVPSNTQRAQVWNPEIHDDILEYISLLGLDAHIEDCLTDMALSKDKTLEKLYTVYHRDQNRFKRHVIRLAERTIASTASSVMTKPALPAVPSVPAGNNCACIISDLERVTHEANDARPVMNNSVVPLSNLSYLGNPPTLRQLEMNGRIKQVRLHQMQQLANLNKEMEAQLASTPIHAVPDIDKAHKLMLRQVKAQHEEQLQALVRNFRGSGR